MTLLIVIGIALSICIIALSVIDYYEYNRASKVAVENMQKFNDEVYLPAAFQALDTVKQYYTKPRTIKIVGKNNMKSQKQRGLDYLDSLSINEIIDLMKKDPKTLIKNLGMTVDDLLKIVNNIEEHQTNGKKEKAQRRERVQTRARTERSKVIKQKSTKTVKKAKSW
jgi:hypothetical protein